MTEEIDEMYEDDSLDDEGVTREELALMQQQSAYSEIGLTEKTLEPDKSVSGKYAQRNLQQGYLKDKGQYNKMSDNISIAMQFKNIPFDVGGFLSHDIAESIFKIIDLQLLLSNSQDGYVREMTATKRNILVKKSGNNTEKGIGN
jgi:hypothetical protein